MNEVGTNDVERFQTLKSKIDSYNASVIEKEVKKKNAEEELNKLLEDLKVLGYNTVEEAQQAYVTLENTVKTSLDEMEAKLNAI